VLDVASLLENVAWSSVRLMLQTAIEPEADEFSARVRAGCGPGPAAT
jgi:hypothetical protein